MKVVKDTEEQYHDPEREEDIEGRNEKHLTLWEQQLKNPIMTLDETLKYVENHYWDCSLTRGLFGEFGFQWLVVTGCLVGKGFGPIWIRRTACVCAERPRVGKFQGKYGQYDELFFSVWRKKQSSSVSSSKLGPVSQRKRWSICTCCQREMSCARTRILL